MNRIQRTVLLALLTLCLPVIGLAQTATDTDLPDFGQTFLPDTTFTGSSLDGWHTIGSAEWKADDGKIIGSASPGSGLLVLDRSYQDVGFHSLFKCTGGCQTGVLFRMEETENGYTGVYMSLNEDDVKPYRVMLNEEGEITSRNRMEYAGGIGYRIAPTGEDDEDGGGWSPPEGENSFPPRPKPEVERPFYRPNTQFRKGDWNQIESFLDVNVIRSFLNDGGEIGGRVGSASDRSGLDGYGPIALHVAGRGKVQFADMMWKDIAMRNTPKEKSSPNFRVRQINDMYYSWGADAADFNQDGITDVVSGPYLYFGPDYTTRREIFPAITTNPSDGFSATHIQHTYDFDNDGWPDILRSAFSATLFMNPDGESRRWKSYDILPDVGQGEITDFVDLDDNGIPELVYEAEGTLRYATPDTADPTQPWTEHIVSEEGYGIAHGIGTGDINGDGRLDIINAFGWWEQPAQIEEGELWEYHPAELGRFGHRANGVGGVLMGIYDVNGDGLNDVVTSLNAHGFGMAWYEQQRAGDGSISFKEHMINDDYSADNTGGVTFSQPHGNTFADVNGDGLLDFIVGKRYWTHLDNYYDPDPYGPPVIYWYETVRDEDAPGGARFEPRLIHNRSGAGSEVTATDIDKDGAVDIITATNRGTFIYWNQFNQGTE